MRKTVVLALAVAVPWLEMIQLTGSDAPGATVEAPTEMLVGIRSGNVGIAVRAIHSAEGCGSGVEICFVNSGNTMGWR